MKIITEKLQNLWNSDEVRVLVLVSLGIQIALIFLAPLRKRITKAWIALTLWLLYLTADNVATLGLGNISHQTPGGSGLSSELTILWAPFLLVHLGGPDTITSYSIEDNELWWRHLLGLVFQVIITVYIFIQSPPTGWLWIPTIFVFIPGLIKFAERTHALRIASKDHIKDKIISELRPGDITKKDRKDKPNTNTDKEEKPTKGNTDNTTPTTPTTPNPTPANRTTEGNTDNTTPTTPTTPNPAPANRTTEGNTDNTTPTTPTTPNPTQANGTTKGFWGNLMVYMGKLMMDNMGKLKGNMGKLMGNIGKLMGSIQSLLFPPEDTIDILVSSLKDSSKDIDESELILEGFRWFNIFKRLLVDVTFPADLLMKSQDRFSDLSTTDALRLVAIELSFLYDYLHTKAVHMHSILGRVLRYFSLLSIIAAFVVFHHLDMQKYVSGDVIITYILFGVGLSLEVIATILLVLSDWTVMALKKTEHSECVVSCITALVEKILKKRNRRWANKIGHFNLVDFSLRDRDTKLAKIMRTLKIKNKWDNMRESKLKPLFGGKLEEIMVTEAKRRAQNVHIYKVLVEARAYRGNKTLERHNQLERLEWSMKREFDESIILWHLATDFCYYEDETSKNSNGQNQQPSHKPNGENQEHSNQPDGENQQPSNQPNRENQQASNQPNGENQEHSDQPNERNEELSNQPNRRKKIPINCLKSCCSSKPNGENQQPSNKPCLSSKQSNKKEDTERDVSWKTSNYMIYLLTQQQSMMQLGYGKTRFEATCAVVKKELKNTFKGKGILKGKEACTELMKEPPPKDPLKEKEAPQVSANGSQPTKKKWACLRCWGRRKQEEDKRKDEEATQVSEENNASVPADGSQPTNIMGTSLLKKIWANLRCWGKRKQEEDKRKREEEDKRKREEENNAPVSTDSSQPTNKMGTSEENNAQVSEENNAPVSTDSSQTTNKMGTSEENNAQVSEENNAPVSTDSSQPTNKMGTSVLKKVWANLRQWGTSVLNWGTSVLKKIWAKLRQWGTSVLNWGTTVLKKIWSKLRQWGTSVLNRTSVLNWGTSVLKKIWGKREYEDEMGELVLRDSRRLANELKQLKPEIKWKLISETWMEMLGYAAIHCDSYQHAKSLSRGGELLTHLWLLMSQLGVVDEHKVQQYQSGTV